MNSNTKDNFIINEEGVFIGIKKSESLSKLRRTLHFPISPGSEFFNCMGLGHYPTEAQIIIADMIQDCLEMWVGNSIMKGCTEFQTRYFQHMAHDLGVMESFLATQENYHDDPLLKQIMESYSTDEETNDILLEYCRIKWMKKCIPSHSEITKVQTKAFVEYLIMDFLKGTGDIIPRTMTLEQRKKHALKMDSSISYHAALGCDGIYDLSKCKDIRLTDAWSDVMKMYDRLNIVPRVDNFITKDTACNMVTVSEEAGDWAAIINKCNDICSKASDLIDYLYTFQDQFANFCESYSQEDVFLYIKDKLAEYKELLCEVLTDIKSRYNRLIEAKNTVQSAAASLESNDKENDSTKSGEQSLEMSCNELIQDISEKLQRIGSCIEAYERALNRKII